MVAIKTWLTDTEYIFVINVPFILIVIESLPHSYYITGYVTRGTRKMPLVKQELLTLLEHLRSPQFVVWFVLLNLEFSVYCFVDHCLSFWSLYCLSFGHCIVCLLVIVLSVPFGHCIVCLLVIVLSVFWSLYCLSFGHCIVCLLVIVLSVFRLKASDNPFGIFHYLIHTIRAFN